MPKPGQSIENPIIGASNEGQNEITTRLYHPPYNGIQLTQSAKLGESSGSDGSDQAFGMESQYGIPDDSGDPTDLLGDEDSSESSEVVSKPRPTPKKKVITNEPTARRTNPIVSVYCGDCRMVIPEIEETYNFIFADPPFNIGQNYRQFSDKRGWVGYREFVKEWMKICWDRLAPNGIIALHGNDYLAEEYILNAREMGWTKGAGKRIAWINWHYRFGQCSRQNWIDARAHCIIYAKDKDHYVWDPESVLVDSDRATVYKDKRIHDTEHGGKRLPGTVWGIPSDGPNWGRVQGSSRERRPNHPNQLPEVYLERLIRAYTRIGGDTLILDPFGGSGTTAVVAQALGRSCTTMDISSDSCDSIRERLKIGAIRVIPVA